MRLILWLMAGLVILAAMKLAAHLLFLAIAAAFVIACIRQPAEMAVLILSLFVISLLANQPPFIGSLVF